MEIKIKRVYEKPAKDDGCRVLVDLVWATRPKKEAGKGRFMAQGHRPEHRTSKWFDHNAAKWDKFRKYYRGTQEKPRGHLAPETRVT
ncbi:MAG TPA: DUF488 family protein [Gammaproteobacteria bacterium]